MCTVPSRHTSSFYTHRICRLFVFSANSNPAFTPFIKSNLFTFIDSMTILPPIVANIISNSLLFLQFPTWDNTSLLSKTERAFDTTITLRRDAGGTSRWFIMHRLGMRSAQSALTLPYDNENDGELIVIVEETGFSFQWTCPENSSDYFRNVCCWQGESLS